MGEVGRAAAALLSAALAAGLLTPVAIRIANRTEFFDHPAGYKAHARVTPYLGGSAVIAGFLLAAVPFGEVLNQMAAVVAVAVVLFLVGTIDDRRHLGIGLRVAAQAAGAAVVWLEDIRWQLTGVDAIDFLITVVWIVGVTNAFNLLDNIDGATGATAATSAAGIGILALSNDAPLLGATAFALAGACVGFLRYNLAIPSRIFLGDGGSLPIGFLLATMAMMATIATGAAAAPLLAAIPLVGVAVFDTSLVVVSRLRRRVSVLTGGRDHLTHRLLTVLDGPRSVAGVLVVAQILLSTLGVLMSDLDEAAAVLVAIGYSIAGLVLLVRMELAPFKPRPTAEMPV